MEERREKRILKGVLGTKLRSDKWRIFYHDVICIFLSYFCDKHGIWLHYKEFWLDRNPDIRTVMEFLFDAPICFSDMYYELKSVFFAKSRTRCIEAMEQLCEGITQNIALRCFICRVSLIDIRYEQICTKCMFKLRNEGFEGKVSFSIWKRVQTSAFIAECATFWLERFVIRDILRVIATLVVSDANHDKCWDHLYYCGKWRK
jgi:hypothetical protein